ncbi:hypothetical protein M9458_018242, partial [Cirrhinus mrigala]
PSQPPPRFAEHEPEPTTDGEPEPNVTEPSPKGATVQRIATDPEPIPSNQWSMMGLWKGAAEGELRLDLGLLYFEQNLINFHEDIYVEQDLIDFYGDVYEDMPPLLSPSSELPVFPKLRVCPERPVCPEQSVYLELLNYLDFPPTLPLLPPPISAAASPLPPVSPGSPSAHPQLTICAVGLLQVCQSPSASWLEDPLSPPPDS